jgi:hypothetical protein
MVDSRKGYGLLYRYLAYISMQQNVINTSYKRLDINYRNENPWYLLVLMGGD